MIHYDTLWYIMIQYDTLWYIMIHYVYWCHIYVFYGSDMYVLKLVYTCALPTSLHGCITIYRSPMVSYLLWSCRETLCHRSALWIWSSVRMISSRSTAVSCDFYVFSDVFLPCHTWHLDTLMTLEAISFRQVSQTSRPEPQLSECVRDVVGIFM